MGDSMVRKIIEGNKDSLQSFLSVLRGEFLKEERETPSHARCSMA
jgi:hypothetical protein